jgi:tetratricopeptide (TPR) repeat protein
MNKLKLLLILLLSLTVLIGNSCKSTENETITDTTQINTYEVLDGEAELLRISELLSKDPNNVKLLAQQADIMFKMQQGDEGLSVISKAFRLDSTNLEVRRVHAGYMMGQLKVLAARDDYAFIIEKNPGNADAYLGMARTYAVEDNYPKAFQFTDEALKRDAKLRDAYVLKGLMFQTQDKINLAISSYQTAVEIDPNFYSGYVALGTLHEKKNDPMAVEYYNTALSIDSNGIEALYGKALFHQNANEIEMAQENYRKLLQVDPDYFFAYYNQGYIKLVMEVQYDSAAYFFTKTVEIMPNYADAWYNLGLSEQARRKNREAIKAFKEALKIDPEMHKAKKEIDAILKL